MKPELAETIFRNAVAAGVMADGEFADTKAGSGGDRGNKRLQEICGKKGGDELTTKHAELTTGIVHAIAENKPACHVREP